MQKNWKRSALPGSYVSTDSRLTAELRPAGRYDGVRLVRHYAIRNRGGEAILGTARTLKEAASMYL